MTANGSTEMLLDTVHHSMLDGLGQLSDYFGFGKVIGQIYGALLLSDRPLCLDDLVERLDISKANASMNMHSLDTLGMVRQVWVRGTSGRRKFYEAETDFYKSIRGILKERQNSEFDSAVRSVRETLDKLESGSVSGDEAEKHFIYERVKALQDFFNALDSLTRAVSRLDSLGLSTVNKVLYILR